VASELVHITCSFCGKEHPSACRPATAERVKKQHQYIVCPDCEQHRPPKAEDEVLVIDIHGFCGWVGWTIRKATPEDIASMERARAIRDAGIRMLKEEQIDRWMQDALGNSPDEGNEQ